MSPLPSGYLVTNVNTVTISQPSSDGILMEKKDLGKIMTLDRYTGEVLTL
jgi:hypothetical protein